mgnify:CR=1 FL=1
MVTTRLSSQLRALEDELLFMGNMVEKSIARALSALQRRDLEDSLQVVRDDDLIDQKRFDIEEACINLIATQHPVARDLRRLVTILHVNVELERMGDYAEGIAKISLMMGDEPPLKPLIDIPRMADKTIDMLKRSLDSLVKRDIATAYQVCGDDDDVDAIYDQVYRELLTYMIEDPKTIKRATYLLWMAHDLERIADRATNIAERVIYLVTGKLTEVNVSKY